MSIDFLKNTHRPAMDVSRDKSEQQPEQPESPREPRKANVSMFNKVIRFCLYAMVLLIPILFLPTSSEAREFNKQSFLFYGVLVMLAVWVIRILTTRAVSWIKTSLDYIVMTFLLVYLISSFFSIDKVSSFLGYYGRYTGSFLSVLCFIVLYYLIVNNVRTEGITRKLTKYLTISSGIVVVFGLLQVLGMHIIPLEFARDRSFNPIGSLVALSIFSAITIILIQWLWMQDEKRSKLSNILLSVVTIAGLLVMFIVNAFVAWLVLGLGIIVFLAIGMVLTAKDQNTSWFWKPMLILVVSILFIGFRFLPASVNPRNLVTVNLPVEIQLSNSTNMDLVKNSLTSGVKQAIIGSGPGTVGIAFGNIKPESLNKTIVWSLNFDRASSEIANIAIETGILGLLAFELTAILFLIYAVYFLLKQTEHPGRTYAYGFFLVWLSLYITHFMYFFNTTFYFLYWLALAVFMAVVHWKHGDEEESTLSFSSSPRSALSWMFASLLILAVLLVGAFFETAVVVAEISYTNGVRTLNQTNPNFESVATKFARSAQLNPYRDVYYLALSQSLVFLSSQEIGKEEPNAENIRSWLADSVNSGLKATEISPGKASNWSALAQFYANIKPLGIAQADEAIIRSWSEAIKRDPKNPTLYIQLARAYSNAAEVIDPARVSSGVDSDNDGLSDQLEQQLGSDPKSADTNSNGIADIDEVKSGFNPKSGRLTSAQISQFTRIDAEKIKLAEAALTKAVALKDDLPDSYVELARIFEKSGKLPEAKKKLDEAVAKFPNNADVKFEQGRIAYNQRNFNEAESIFNSVIKLSPNHANAHYSLGLVYQQKGDNAKALAQFEKTREITGPNADLERLIDSLK